MTRPTLGAVAIGRNEGDRLKACLHSLVPVCDRVVYVDSGSRDDSVAFARGLGVTVVELDTTTPFTAARARNAGFEALLADEELDLVQFVDGDCKVRPAAQEFIKGAKIEHSVVFLATPESGRCGKLRERLAGQVSPAILVKSDTDHIVLSRMMKQ